MLSTDQGGLFDVDELVALPNAGRAEAGLVKALEAAAGSHVIGPNDAGLVAAALVAARALDRAEALPDKSAVYAVGQLLPAYQKVLHGLRLPAELTPATVPPASDPTPAAGEAPSWLGDALGPR